MSSHRVAPSTFFLWMLALAAQPSWVLAVTWVVDGDSASCNDAGPGNPDAPFCTIEWASSRAEPGDTVLVHAALYREQVTVPRSGVPGLPITYRAFEAGAVILGTDDLSDPASWSPTGTTAWSRPFAPESSPKQVFLNGVPVAEGPPPGSASAASSDFDGMAIMLDIGPGHPEPVGGSGAEPRPHSYFYDPLAQLLYVDVGGPNPAGEHVIEAGARSHGFSLVGRSHIVIEGFEIRHQNSTGLRLSAGCSNVVARGNVISRTGGNGILSDAGSGPILIEANTVSLAGSTGIRLLNSTGVTVRGNISRQNENHGLSLHGSSGNSIVWNLSYWNARPTTRAANGLDVNGASRGNIIQANTFFNNQDSGCQLYNGSNDNLVVRNVSYRNGDHGFDTNQASGTRYVSNTSQGNFKTGFSVEGSSTGTVMANNIAVDNGLETDEPELYVDPNSTAGFSADYDILYRSGPGSVAKFAGVRYETMDAFAAATGQETHGLGEDPMFLDPSRGDLRVGIGPAVDSADSGASGFSVEDRDGWEPMDILEMTNTGAGPIPYADRGAFELVDPPAAASFTGHPQPPARPPRAPGHRAGTCARPEVSGSTSDRQGSG